VVHSEQMHLHFNWGWYVAVKGTVCGVWAKRPMRTCWSCQGHVLRRPTHVCTNTQVTVGATAGVLADILDLSVLHSVNEASWYSDDASQCSSCACALGMTGTMQRRCTSITNCWPWSSCTTGCPCTLCGRPCRWYDAPLPPSHTRTLFCLLWTCRPSVSRERRARVWGGRLPTHI
jgi:hypothetical protein